MMASKRKENEVAFAFGKLATFHLYTTQIDKGSLSMHSIGTSTDISSSMVIGYIINDKDIVHPNKFSSPINYLIQ